MPLILKKNEADVKQWKSEHMIPCAFCIASRVPDPNHVIVSLESGNDTISICEVCIKGATIAIVQEYRRLTERFKKPPSKPTDPKRKRTIRYV